MIKKILFVIFKPIKFIWDKWSEFYDWRNEMVWQSFVDEFNKHPDKYIAILEKRKQKEEEKSKYANYPSEYFRDLNKWWHKINEKYYVVEDLKKENLSKDKADFVKENSRKNAVLDPFKQVGKDISGWFDSFYKK